MNATAATGTNQAILLAAFTLPLANAAPATPAFVNMISLMLSSPNQTAPQVASDASLKSPAARTAANPWAIAASPAQIADAMIRSMLGSPAAAVPAVPVSADPSLNDLLNDLSNDLAVPAPIGAREANPAAPLTANLNQTARLSPEQPSPERPARKPAPRGPGVPLPAVISAMPVETIIVSAPPVTSPPAGPPAGDSKGNVVPATTPQPAPTAPAAPARSFPEMKLAFSAILTPLKDTPAIGAAAGQIAPLPEPSAGAFKPAAVENPQPQAATPVTSMQVTSMQVTSGQAATETNGDSQPGGDTPSQQKNDSPETPARPIAARSDTKIKPDVQQDDSALEAAAAASVVVHSPAVPSFAVTPNDPTRSAVTSTTAPAATPYNATAEALRTTESNLAAAPPLRTGAAQEIAIRIATADSPAVDLRVVEKAGQVHVDVRTQDSGMQSSLRQELGTLTNSLERAGYHTETFIPSSTLARAASSAQAGNQDHQQDPSQNRGGSADSSGGRRQQQQKRSGTWLEDLEEQP